MNTKLLHIDSSILGGNSVSRTLSAGIVNKFKAAHPEVDVIYRDLASSPIPHLSGAYFAASRDPEASNDAALMRDIELGRAILEEFLAADVVVIGVAFYNFSIASQLKAWIDRIAVAGKTFRYTDRGPEGLVTGKRIILAIARGGHYGPGSRNAALEHAEAYLRSVFSFVGVSQLEVVAANGVSAGAEQRQVAIEQAQQQIDDLLPT
ncbi:MULTISPECIES: FMN-dependent NADH-azoreductase [Cupriavidus]|uniref:FMN-dependent NADH-azoreductase n=1 Tax=Cupriavidus sp. SK-3 TaxID=1470558 RepID=UPI0004529FC2|nr:FMN-dependent NADH-azoreductase [Cupriavidus sp. SK-3]KDP86239.1 FMN-dependent NADH-azoreductase [Cupriavidus sp. SK-3]